MAIKKSMEELERISAEDFRVAKKTPVVVVLDEVRSMNNVGSIFRSADAFLVEKIVLCGLTPTPPHRDIQKTALGATETVAWEHAATTAQAIQDLIALGYWIVAVEQTHNSLWLHQFPFTLHAKVALVFGHEVYGVHEDVLALCDNVIEIPQLGSKHSLNIAVSAGIVLWAFSQSFLLGSSSTSE